MGAYGWGKNHPVIDWLLAEGYRFDFFQAVRLLEIYFSPEKSLEDEGIELDREAVAVAPSSSGETPSTFFLLKENEKHAAKDFLRFKSSVRLNFPTSDIDKVKLHGLKPGGKLLAEMTVNLMGLAGALGPLDMPTTELIIDRLSKRDRGIKDFLDIFNHRLVSLLYRIRKIHRIGLENVPPGQDKIAQYLFSIIGLGTNGLMGRMQVKDRSLLNYAGLLGQMPHSLVGLERILADYFQVKVKGHQFIGQWYDLDESQWTRIGVTGQNQVLGRDPVVLGTRVWDQQAKIEIQLGPMTLQQFLTFIPTGWGFRSLCDLTRFYLGDTLDVSFRLVLKGEEVPPPVLGMTDEPRLGWTSWLTPRSPRIDLAQHPDARLPAKQKGVKDDSQVEIRLSTNQPSEFESERLPLFFNLPPTQLAELIGLMEVHQYRKFETVMAQGEPGDSMFAIRSGRVQMTRREADGKVSPPVIHGPGECFGEMTLIANKHREATVTALEDCVILELHKDDFDVFASQNPRWRRTLKAYRYGQFVKHQEKSREIFI